MWYCGTNELQITCGKASVMKYAVLKTPEHNAHIRKLPEPKIRVRSTSQRLVVSTSNGVHVIPHQEIIRCAANGNYCAVILTSGKKILVSKTLKFIQEQLSSTAFLRVHQSHLINLDFVRFLGKDYTLLNDKTKIPISRSRLLKVRKVFLPQKST